MATKKVKQLTEEQIFEYKEAFALFDRDGDALLAPSELGVVMRALGLTPTEADLKEMITTVDKDNNGKLDFAEFLTLVAQKGLGEMDDAEVREAFRVFDRENNGMISEAEFKHILTDIGDKVTPDECAEMMKEVKISNGQINYDEFIKLMIKSINKWIYRCTCNCLINLFTWFYTLVHYV